MNKPRITAVVLALLAVVLLAGTAGAAGPAIKWQVFSSAGALVTGGSFTLNSSLGQTAVGLATTLNYNGTSGYWYPKGRLGVEWQYYLPLLVRKWAH